MGVILAIVSIILYCFMFPIGLVTTIFRLLYKRKWKGFWKKLDKKFLSIATSVDASGNVVCDDFFNFIFIKSNGYKFGKRKETISSVLGKNERDGTLTLVGIWMVNILHFFEKEHSEKSIDDIV